MTAKYIERIDHSNKDAELSNADDFGLKRKQKVQIS